jgi:uncharacterized repeat protein (TIGR01451 family)
MTGSLRRFTLLSSVLALVTVASAEAVPVDARIRGELSGLRLPFIANEQQVDPRVAYYARTFAGTVFVTHRGELVYKLPAHPAEGPRKAMRPPTGPGWSLTETFVRGRPRPTGQERSETGVSYFVGKDPARWRPQVSAYEQVSLGEVWSGVSVEVRAHGRNVEKVFTVAPGASVDRIRVGVRGAHGLALSGDGALVARTGLGDVTFTAPVAYQERDGLRHPVTVAYRMRGKEYGFTVGTYDRALPLVIDPLLQSTYLGGTAFDGARALAIAPTGDVYVAGQTESVDFPGTLGGAQPTNAGFGDAFVARLNSTLTSLIRATYLGGTGFDGGCGLAIHPTTGDIYVVGGTDSTDFPGTTGGAQPLYGGGFQDVFVARLNSTLTSLGQATYLGGSNEEGACAVAITGTGGDVYVTGFTVSDDFPGTGGGAQPTKAGFVDAFIARVRSDLTTGALTQATYLGGTSDNAANALAIHPMTGDVYVAGLTFSDDFPGTGGGAQPTKAGFVDAFIARVRSDLTTGALTQATYLGGTDGQEAFSLAIHPTTGDVYVAGVTFSDDFPGTTGGAQPTKADFADAFIARLRSDLTTGALTQATYLGGDDDDIPHSLAIHPTTGDVYVAGFTFSDDFPGAAGGVQPHRAGGRDGFVARLRNDLTTGALTQATYLGGSTADTAFAVAIRPATGEVYVAGQTSSTDFPGTAGGAQPTKSSGTDAFVARLTANLVAVDPGPDVTLTKTHVDDFIRGQIGATYTITVTNVGVVPTLGAVTVTDSLPAGLTATAFGGAGWTCVLATLTCTRSDALANGASYPVITLTVNVATSAADSITNTATVSGGGDVNAANNTANDPTTVRSFADVPPDHPLFAWIEALAAAGITGGCASNPSQYCPDGAVSRGEMAVFLLRGIHGAGYTPPAATGTVFADVPAGHPLAAWIEQLALEGITGGCATDPQRYCPDAGVTRGEMAVFLLRAKHGPGYEPPAATGTVFVDVPVGHPFAKWIEQLALEGITGGCGVNPSRYCPDAGVTRGQMAVFLVRTFGLPL